MRIKHYLVFVWSVLIGGSLSANDRYDLALVSLADENRVSIVELDKQEQTLRRLGHLEVNGDAGSQFFDKKRSVLFLGLRNAGKIAAIKLDRKDKTLRVVDEVAVDKDPAYLRVDRTGKWLWAAYYATGRISCFRLEANGSFSRNRGETHANEEGKNSKLLKNRSAAGQGKRHELADPQWLSTAPKAHAIVEDSTNRFVFVPHTGPNAIFQFRFDQKLGKLKPLPKPRLVFSKGTGPRHIVNHPTMPSLWFSINEQGSSVTSLAMDDQGFLSPVKTISTLPESYREQNACADLEITSDGRFLFAANRGHDSLALFRVSADGDFSRTGVFATEKTPRQFSISPDDRFLVAAGQGSNRLVLFFINPKHGRLKKVQTLDTGKKPWWVTLVD